MKIMIDTNVLLDAFLSREPWRENAERIILACADGKLHGCLTASSLTDIYYILNKSLKNPEEVREAIGKIFILFDVLDVTKADCEKALELPIIDYEDALLVHCAKRHKIEMIVSRDEKYFTSSPVSVISPGELLHTF